MEESSKRQEFSLKQQFWLQSYRLQQAIRAWCLKKKKWLFDSLDTFYFQAFVFSVLLCSTHYLFELYNLNLSRDQLISAGFTIAGFNRNKWVAAESVAFCRLDSAMSASASTL